VFFLKFTGINHLAIVTRDMDKTIRFWGDLLEMRLVAGLRKHVLLMDARYTSQKCSECGHIYKGNREGSLFRCRKCGFELHADLNASRNIAQAGIYCLGRLPVNQPIVTT